jgi:hypothetical protein
VRHGTARGVVMPVAQEVRDGIAQQGFLFGQVEIHWEQKGRQEGCTFLKKRTKKLLLVTGGRRDSRLPAMPDAICKSFSLLFFKKEGLFLPAAST